MLSRQSSKQQTADRVAAGVTAYGSLCESLQASTKEVAAAAQGLAAKEGSFASTEAVRQAAALQGSPAARCGPGRRARARRQPAGCRPLWPSWTPP